MKTLCNYCQTYLHFDCSKCNLPKEDRHITHKSKAGTLDKIYGLHGGIKGIK